MDTALHLRRHSTVVRDRERKGLVSVGAAFRYRKSREAAARAAERKHEQMRAGSWNLDNPCITEKRREEIRARQRMAELS